MMVAEELTSWRLHPESKSIARWQEQPRRGAEVSLRPEVAQP